ncbi:UPF0104 family protein [Candidatus Saccharibacteria bacterium]|nr:UPF0104 family protein [Candidatus Saccharibacteria bacterium]
MFKKILSAVTLILVVVIGYSTFSEVVTIDGREMTMFQATVDAFRELNIWVLLLLIPEQFMMYFAAGQMYFSFLKQRRKMKVSNLKLTRISLEINFVNHTMPSGGMSGLAYLIWRLRELEVSAGQVSFIHGLRYAICAVGNAVQTMIAIIVVLIAGCVRPGNGWYLWLAGGIAAGIQLLIVVAVLVLRKQKNVDFLKDKLANFADRWQRRKNQNRANNPEKPAKKRNFTRENVERFFTDMRSDYLALMRDKNILKKPIIWGFVFSFLELATYWVVGCALGHPEILPQIMIAEGVASVVGTVMVTPGGLGGYEGAFVAVLVATGVDLSIATIVVIVTRIVVLTLTIMSGLGFYQQALMSSDSRFDVGKVREMERKEEERRRKEEEALKADAARESLEEQKAHFVKEKPAEEKAKEASKSETKEVETKA